MRFNPEEKALIRRAKLGRGFLKPEFSSAARWFMIIIGGLYLRVLEGVSKISIIREERIIEAMRAFHAEEHRLIFVFRHAAEEDPPVLMTMFNKTLRRKIERGNNLSHVRFLYGRDVPNWAGSAAAWLFPKIGAIPVQNRGGNREALNILRREMKDGRFPVALAPEEQVVYHMYRTSGLAPGISSLVRWGLESGKPVTVIPLAPGYRYGGNPDAFIRKMLLRWEEQTGFKLANLSEGPLHPLLTEAADRTISLLEEYYGLPQAAGNKEREPEGIDRRIEVLSSAILSAAERSANLSSDGDDMERLFRIRYAGVDSFYPEHLNPAEQPKLQRALLDLRALENEASIRHSQIIDVLEYIRMSYISPPFSAGRGCEFILNLLDLINRTDGGDISGHYTPSGQHAAVLAGKPLVYSDAEHRGMGRREFLDKIRMDVKDALQAASEELEDVWEIIKLE